jgi:hypothetical protein
MDSVGLDLTLQPMQLQCRTAGQDANCCCICGEQGTLRKNQNLLVFTHDLRGRYAGFTHDTQYLRKIYTVVPNDLRVCYALYTVFTPH